MQINRTAIATLLVVLLPASLLAQNPNGMVYTSGSVLLNGVPAPGSSAVFSGDRVTTGKSSAASLVLNGSSIVVDAESTVLYEGNSFVLQGGGASVMTSKSMAARCGHRNVSIVPAAAVETDYRVVQEQNNLVIAPKVGAVKVIDKEGENLLPEGKVMTVACFDVDDNNRKPGAGPAITSQGYTNGNLVLIGLAAASGAAALALTLSGSGKKCVSPDASLQCN